MADQGYDRNSYFPCCALYRQKTNNHQRTNNRTYSTKNSCFHCFNHRKTIRHNRRPRKIRRSCQTRSTAEQDSSQTYFHRTTIGFNRINKRTLYSRPACHAKHRRGAKTHQNDNKTTKYPLNEAPSKPELDPFMIMSYSVGLMLFRQGATGGSFLFISRVT